MPGRAIRVLELTPIRELLDHQPGLRLGEPDLAIGLVEVAFEVRDSAQEKAEGPRPRKAEALHRAADNAIGMLRCAGDSMRLPREPHALPRTAVEVRVLPAPREFQDSVQSPQSPLMP